MKPTRISSGVERNKRLAENMTLREALEFTRDLDLKGGGLSIILERIVEEIEKLKNKFAD